MISKVEIWFKKPIWILQDTFFFFPSYGPLFFLTGLEKIIEKILFLTHKGEHSVQLKP